MRPDRSACDSEFSPILDAARPEIHNLLEQEPNFRGWADFLPQPICIAAPDGEIYWYNRCWQDVTGRSGEELTGMGWPLAQGRLSEAWRQDWKHGIATGEPFEIPVDLNVSATVSRPFLLRVSPIRESHGPVLRWLAVGTDLGGQVKAEQLLQDVRQEYEALFHHAQECILVADNEGRYLNANPMACRTFGLSLQQIVGRSVQELFLPGQEEQFQAMWRHFLQEGFMSGEIPYTKPDGSIVHFEFCAVADYSPNRNLSVLRDVTARKAAEAALLESEQRFRTMADSAPLFIWLNDEDGRTHFLNKTWLEFLGMSAPEAIAWGLKASMMPEEQAEFAATCQAAIMNRECFTLETRFKRSDGEIRWLWTQGAPLLLANGTVTGYIGISLDITDRKLSEGNLQYGLDRERLLRRMVEIKSQSFDIDFILKTVAQETGRYFQADRCSVSRFSVQDGQIRFNLSAQYAAENYTPFNPEDIELVTSVGQYLCPEATAENYETIVNVSDQEQYIRYLREWLAAFPDLPVQMGDKLIEVVLKYNLKSSLKVNIYYRGTHYGSISLSQCSHNRVWQPDEIRLLKAIAGHAGSAIYQAELYRTAQETAVREHRARKELERYARKLEISNRELEQFATIASHDLQEPLRKVRIFSQMLAAHCRDEGREYVDRMQTSVSRMQDLITDVLALSRINRAGLPFQTVNLSKCIQNVLDDLALTIQEKKPHLSIEPLREIEGDARQLEQLFLNLIGNALKFHEPDQAPRIRIFGEQVEENLYRITVSDQGIGFNPAYRERIFEPFERLHGRAGKYIGTGMGLAIVRKIVERHNGTIQVVSSEGDGASFRVTLPIAHHAV